MWKFRPKEPSESTEQLKKITREVALEPVWVYDESVADSPALFTGDRMAKMREI